MSSKQDIYQYLFGQLSTDGLRKKIQNQVLTYILKNYPIHNEQDNIIYNLIQICTEIMGERWVDLKTQRILDLLKIILDQNSVIITRKRDGNISVIGNKLSPNSFYQILPINGSSDMYPMSFSLMENNSTSVISFTRNIGGQQHSSMDTQSVFNDLTAQDLNKIAMAYVKGDGLSDVNPSGQQDKLLLNQVKQENLIYEDTIQCKFFLQLLETQFSKPCQMFKKQKRGITAQPFFFSIAVILLRMAINSLKEISIDLFNPAQAVDLIYQILSSPTDLFKTYINGNICENKYKLLHRLFKIVNEYVPDNNIYMYIQTMNDTFQKCKKDIEQRKQKEYENFDFDCQVSRFTIVLIQYFVSKNLKFQSNPKTNAFPVFIFDKGLCDFIQNGAINGAWQLGQIQDYYHTNEIIDKFYAQSPFDLQSHMDQMSREILEYECSYVIPDTIEKYNEDVQTPQDYSLYSDKHNVNLRKIMRFVFRDADLVVNNRNQYFECIKDYKQVKEYDVQGVFTLKLNLKIEDNDKDLQGDQKIMDVNSENIDVDKAVSFRQIGVLFNQTLESFNVIMQINGKLNYDKNLNIKEKIFYGKMFQYSDCKTPKLTLFLTDQGIRVDESIEDFLNREAEEECELKTQLLLKEIHGDKNSFFPFEQDPLYIEYNIAKNRLAQEQQNDNTQVQIEQIRQANKSIKITLKLSEIVQKFKLSTSLARTENINNIILTLGLGDDQNQNEVIYQRLHDNIQLCINQINKQEPSSGVFQMKVDGFKFTYITTKTSKYNLLKEIIDATGDRYKSMSKDEINFLVPDHILGNTLRNVTDVTPYNNVSDMNSNIVGIMTAFQAGKVTDYTQRRISAFMSLINQLLKTFGRFKDNSGEISRLKQQIQNEDSQIQSIQSERANLLQQMQNNVKQAQSKLKKNVQNIDSSKYYIDLRVVNQASVPKKLIEVDVNNQIIELNRLNYKINLQLLSQLYPGSQVEDKNREMEIKTMIQKENAKAIQDLKSKPNTTSYDEFIDCLVRYKVLRKFENTVPGEMSTVERVQREFFKTSEQMKSQVKNTIFGLDTGAGKTDVMIMKLIQDLCAEPRCIYYVTLGTLIEKQYYDINKFILIREIKNRRCMRLQTQRQVDNHIGDENTLFLVDQKQFFMLLYYNKIYPKSMIICDEIQTFFSSDGYQLQINEQDPSGKNTYQDKLFNFIKNAMKYLDSELSEKAQVIQAGPGNIPLLQLKKIKPNPIKNNVLQNQSHPVIQSQLTSNYQQFLDEVEINQQFSSKMKRIIDQKEVNKNYGHKFYGVFSDMCVMSDNIKNFMAFPYKGSNNVQCDQSFTQLYTQIMLMVKMLSYDLSDPNGGEQFFQDLMPFIEDILQVFRKFNDNKNVEIWKILLKFIKYSSSQKILTIYDILQYIVHSDSRLIGFTATPVLDIELDEVCNIVDERKRLNLDFYIQTATGMKPYLTGQEETFKQKNDYFMDFQTQQFMDIKKYIRIAVDKKNIDWVEVKKKLTEIYANYSSRSVGFCDLGQFFTTKNEETCKLIREKLGLNGHEIQYFDDVKSLDKAPVSRGKFVSYFSSSQYVGVNPGTDKDIGVMILTGDIYNLTIDQFYQTIGRARRQYNDKGKEFVLMFLQEKTNIEGEQNKNIQTQNMIQDIGLTVEFTRRQKQDVVQRSYKYLSAFKMKRVFDFQRERQPFQNEFVRKQYNPIIDHNIQNTIVKVVDINLHKELVKFYRNQKNIGAQMSAFVEKQFQLKANNNYNDVQLQVTRDNELISRVTTKSVIKYSDGVINDFDITFSNEIDIDQMKKYIYQIKNGKYDKKLLDYLNVCEQFPINNMKRTDIYDKCGQLMADVQKQDDVNVVINEQLNIIYSKQYQIAIYRVPQKGIENDSNYLEEYLLDQLNQIQKGTGQNLSTQEQSKQFLNTKNKYDSKLQTLQIIRYYLKMTEELKDYIYATNLEIVKVLFNDSQPDQRDQLMREIVISNFNFNYAQEDLLNDTKQVQFLVFMYQIDKLGAIANDGSINIIEEMIQTGKVTDIGEVFSKSNVIDGDMQLSNMFWNFIKNYGAYIDEEKIQYAAKRVQNFIEGYQDDKRQVFQLAKDKFGLSEYIGGAPDTVEQQIANIFKDDDDKIQQEITKYQDLIYKLFLSSNLAQIPQDKLIQYFAKFLESNVLKYDELIKYNQGDVLNRVQGKLIEHFLNEKDSERLLNKLFENGFQDMVIEYINGNRVQTSNPVILYLKRILPKRKMKKGTDDYEQFFLDGDVTIDFGKFIQQRLEQAKFCPRGIATLYIQQDITEILNMALLCPNDQQMFDFAVLMSDSHVQIFLQSLRKTTVNIMNNDPNGYVEWYEKQYELMIQQQDYQDLHQSFKNYIMAYIGAQRGKGVKIEDVVGLMDQYYNQTNTKVTLKMIQQNIQGLKEQKIDEFLNSYILKQTIVNDLNDKMTEDQQKISELQTQLSQKDGIIAQQIKTINGIQKIIEQIIEVINHQQIQNDKFIELIQKNLHILQVLFGKIMDKLLLVDKNEDDYKKLEQAELSVFKGKLKKIVNGFEKYWSQDNLKQINKFLQLFKQNVTSKMIQIQYTDESDRFEDIKKVMDQLKERMKMMKTQQIIEQNDDMDRDPVIENFKQLMDQQSNIFIKVNRMQELLAEYDPKYSNSLTDVISRVDDCKDRIQSVMDEYLVLLDHIILQQNTKNTMQAEYSDLYQIMNQIDLIETDIANIQNTDKKEGQVDSQQFLDKIKHLQDQLVDMEQKKNIAVVDANNMIKIKQQYNQLLEQQESEKLEKKSLQEQIEQMKKIQEYANQNAKSEDQQSNLDKIAQLQLKLDELLLEKSKIKNIHDMYDKKQKDYIKRRDDVIQEYEKKLGNKIEQDIGNLVGKLDQNGHADTLCDRFLNKFRTQDDFDEVVQSNDLNEFLIDILVIKKHQGLTSETGEQYGVVHELSKMALHKEKIVISDVFKAGIHEYVMKNCLQTPMDVTEYNAVKKELTEELAAQLKHVVDQIIADSSDEQLKQVREFLMQDNKISDLIGVQAVIEQVLQDSFNVYVQEVDQWDQVTIFQKYGDNLFKDLMQQGLNVDKIKEDALRSSQIIDKFIQIYRQTSNQGKFLQKFVSFLMSDQFEQAETILYQAIVNKSVSQKEEKLYKKLLEITKQNELQQDMVIQKAEQQKEGIEGFREKIQDQYRDQFDLLIKEYSDRIEQLTKERDALQNELDDLKSRISNADRGNSEDQKKKYNDLLQLFAAII